ncbi:GNAT family N-acetyltransferase [Martelella sp. HB161492]|uniref:GNAT family N-acetyltransferase n=1 Tax=Martelella sp. HB161492 TaxID=2720726 RepID=UPI00159123A4|nr:GNAT family N-acetyltransferase [Martelella sp. HB161492]
MHELIFRNDYGRTPEGRAALKSLIGDIFGLDITPLDRLGHNPDVIAFGWWQGDRLIANVSLFRRVLWLCGQRTEAFGVQSVAVRPEFRRRGLFFDLMTRALAFADERVGLVILMTDSPALYARFGFRPLQEHACIATPDPVPGLRDARALSLADDADLRLVVDLFRRRAPTSLRASATDHPALFLLKAFTDGTIELVHLQHLETVVALKRPAAAPVVLLDVLSPAPPPLQDIAAALGIAGSTFELRMTADLIAPDATPLAPVHRGHMVRGPFPAESSPFMLSTMHI